MTLRAQVDGGTEDARLVARVPDDQAELLDLAARLAGQFHHLVQQRHGQVVHDEPAEVLEIVGRLRPTGPGEPSDDEDVGH